MNLRRIALGGLVAAAAAAAAPGPAPQTLVPEQSEVAYVATQMGVTVEGSFSRFSAT